MTTVMRIDNDRAPSHRKPALPRMTDLAETVMRLHIQGACVFLMDVMAGKSLTRTQHRQRRRRRSATAEVTP